MISSLAVASALLWSGRTIVLPKFRGSLETHSEMGDPIMTLSGSKSKWILDTGVANSHRVDGSPALSIDGFKFLPWKDLVESHRVHWEGMKKDVSGVIGSDIFARDGLTLDFRNASLYERKFRGDGNFYLQIGTKDGEPYGYMLPLGCDGRLFKSKGEVFESGLDFYLPEARAVVAEFYRDTWGDDVDKYGFIKLRGREFVLDTDAQSNGMSHWMWTKLGLKGSGSISVSGPAIGENEGLLLENARIDFAPGDWFELGTTAGFLENSEFDLDLFGLPFFLNYHLTFFAGRQEVEIRRYQGLRSQRRELPGARIFIATDTIKFPGGDPFLVELEPGDDFVVEAPFFVSGSDADTKIEWLEDGRAKITSKIAE